MAFKVLVAACVLAVASAQYGGYHAPAPRYSPAPSYGGYAQPEPYAHPQYSFHYAVNDPHTYDIKSQHEERDGDYVKGSYELYEPDGTKRVVEYYDQGYGFQATVHKTAPAAGYAAPAYSAPRPAYSAPRYPSYSAPRPAYH